MGLEFRLMTEHKPQLHHLNTPFSVRS
jgi:hypothetical protein